jgi:phage terminase small subunit
MKTSKDEKFLAGKTLGGRPSVVEARITAPVKPHKPRVLSPQEWKFVEEFCAEDGRLNMREVAIRAGYSESWARNRSRELTDPELNPHIVAAIQERRKELGEKYGTTYERHMRDLQLIRDQALTAGAYGAAVQAEYRRGQALGTIYIDRKEIRHGTIDSMSKDEVMRKLEEIRRLYGQSGGPVIDITPRQLEADPEVAELPDTIPAEPDEDTADEDTADARPPENGEPHASEAGEPPIQQGPGKPRKLPYIPD